jgi:hypothetical protein
MLQYPIQLPPLSLSSSKPKARKAMSVPALQQPPLPPADATHDSNAATSKRTGTAGRTRPTLSATPAYGHSIPLAISTACPPPRSSFSRSPSPSVHSSSLSSPSLPPTPSLGSSFPFSQHHTVPSPRLPSAQLAKAATRSPYVANAALPSAPVPVPGGMRSPRSPKPAPLAYSALPSPALPSPPLAAHSTFSASNSYYGGASSTRSSFSSGAIDVLAPGEIVGEGLSLQGEIVRRVPMDDVDGAKVRAEEPANVFEVVRRLGAGSYAVVYLVREVLRMGDWQDEFCESDGADLDMSLDGHDRDEVCVYKQESRGHVYGKEYAVKLLSKANLDDEALNAQMCEVRLVDAFLSERTLIPEFYRRR